MSNIKVSVVIPVYNTEDYVAETINSIIKQTRSDIEIIIINDGSTDGSLQIMKDFGSRDNRIRILSQENKGLSETRNEGIRCAKGEYIYFMDSDDLLSPEALDNCYKKCKSEVLDFVFFDAEPFGTLKNSPALTYQRSAVIDDSVCSGIDMLNRLFAINSFQTSACLNFINLAFLRRTGLTFYPNIVHEDELFTLMLYIHADRVAYIPETYFKRRLRENSIMTTKLSRRNINGYFTVASELIKLKNNSGSDEIASVIDKRLSDMIPAVLYISRSLNVRDRYYVVSNCLNYFKKYSSWKYILLTLFPVSRFKNSIKAS